MEHNRNFKNKHTSPEKAGAKNLEGKEIPKGDPVLIEQIHGAWLHGFTVKERVNSQEYKGKWTIDLLAEEVAKFFIYCMDTKAKPTPPLLRLWLSVSKDQFLEWRTNKSGKYGDKSVILKNAMEYIECYMQGNIDKYPTGNIFLLKTQFGHVEANRLDITTNGQEITDSSHVRDMVSRLGLDKEKED